MASYITVISPITTLVKAQQPIAGGDLPVDKKPDPCEICPCVCVCVVVIITPPL